MKSNIFIISGPSAAGEDSIIEGLKKIIDFEKIITTTSRSMRSFESQGSPYYFVSQEKFEEMIKENKFFEHAIEDNNNYYGGTYEELERVKKSNKPVIWKVDFQGVIAGKKLIPESKSILIYIPKKLIIKRLKKRDNASADYIKGRLEHSRGWYENEKIFDYKVYNKEGKLNETIKKVAEIIKNNTGEKSN